MPLLYFLTSHSIQSELRGGQFTYQMSSVEQVPQYFVNVVEEQHKLPTLIDMYGQVPIEKAVIFVNSSKAVRNLAADLKVQQFSVCVLDDTSNESDADCVLQQFTSKDGARVLITTDTFAKCLTDLQGITVVVNYELPKDAEQYHFRVGRFASGKTKVLNICTKEDSGSKNSLEQRYQTHMEEISGDFSALCEAYE